MAYESGRLSSTEQTWLQRWALRHYILASRRFQRDELREIKQLLHYQLRVTNHKFYEAAFPTNEVTSDDMDGGVSYGVEDLESLEVMLAEMDRVHTKSLSSMPEWTEWR